MQTQHLTELESYIRSYFGVANEDLEKIGSLFTYQELKKGNYFLKTGNLCDRLSFVKSGLLRIFVTKENKEITQWISTPGYFVTDLSSLVFEVPARWNIQAINDVELYTIYKEDYNRMGSVIPKWHELEKLFITKCFAILEDRILSHLSMTAEERYHQLFQFNKELFNQVPLQYLASMLGMTAETLSRIRKKG